MSYQPRGPLLQVAGTVERTNRWGIQIDNVWYDYSKTKDVDVPKDCQEGEFVELQVEGKYIVTMNRGVPPRPAARPTNGVLPNQRPSEYDDSPSQRLTQDVAVRSIAVQSAAIFLATKKRPGKDGREREASSDDVLRVAAKFANYMTSGIIPPLPEETPASSGN